MRRKIEFTFLRKNRNQKTLRLVFQNFESDKSL